MRAGGGGAALAAALVTWLAGCGPAGEPAPGAVEPAGARERADRAPVAPTTRATLSIEPPELTLGSVATLRLWISTPPDHRVLPIEFPDPAATPGLWLLDAASDPPQRAPGRWLHRTRLRVRAREVGVHAWPELRVEIEDPEGVRETLVVPGREIEVVSVLSEHAGRTTPFGLLEPSRESDGDGRGMVWLAALGGAAAALCAVLGAALARRSVRGRKPGPDPEPRPARVPDRVAVAQLSDRAEQALADALARADEDPREAADVGSRTLRGYVAWRFGCDADCSTTEELREASPPARMRDSTGGRGSWPGLLRILHDLDGVRFPPPPPPGSPAEREQRRRETRDALERASHFVRVTRPDGPRAT